MNSFFDHLTNSVCVRVGPWLIKPLRIDQSEHEIFHHTELTENTEKKIFKLKKLCALCELERSGREIIFTQSPQRSQRDQIF
jgi:hypothetical protein